MKPMYLVMRYDDGSRYPLGVVHGDVLFHRTKRSQHHAPTSAPVAFDTGFVTAARSLGIKRVHHRWTYERPVREIDVETIETYPARETVLDSRPETRFRHFPAATEWREITPYNCPVVEEDKDEITINEQGEVVSIGADTRRKAA